MTNRSFQLPKVGLAVLTLLAFSVVWGFCRSDLVDDRPNFVFVLVDDMGWADSGVYGSDFYETPNLDRLAASGVRFTNAYSAGPSCSPTRASLLLGQYPSRVRVTRPRGHVKASAIDRQLYPDRASRHRKRVAPVSLPGIPKSEYTLAEALRDAGYVTGHIGKWHLGIGEDDGPESHGFQFAVYGTPDARPPRYHSPYGFPGGALEDGDGGEYLTDHLTEEALRFIEINRERPFFLQLWHFAAHAPWGHDEDVTRRFAKKRPGNVHRNPVMASMLWSVDRSLGRVIEKLESLGIDDRTVIVFFSDNGGNVQQQLDRVTADPGHPRHAEFLDYRTWAGDLPPTDNFPLRGGKGEVYEGGVRVPLVVRWPRDAVGGLVTRELASSVDLYPTILEIAGVSLSSSHRVDGVSLAPVLRGQPGVQERSVFLYQVGSGQAKGDAVAVRKGDWKLIRWSGMDGEVDLYNVTSDVSERSDVSGEHPHRVAALGSELDKWITDTGFLFSKENPNYFPRASERWGLEDNSECLDGWVARNLDLVRGTQGVVIERIRNPAYLALSGLRDLEEGLSYSLVFQFASPVCCAAKMHWRERGQSDFSGEKHENMSERSNMVALHFRSHDGLGQLRFFPPFENGPAELKEAALLGADGEVLREWRFGRGATCARENFEPASREYLDLAPAVSPELREVSFSGR